MSSTHTGIKALATGRADLYRLAPADIHIQDGWNGRDFTDPANIEHVEQLSRSIAEIGVKQPLRVKWQDGKAYLTDGESRLRAVRLAVERGAEIKSVPVVKEDQYSSEADQLFVQIVANSGKGLTPLETAKVFKRLLDYGWSVDDIAGKSGMVKQRVTDLLTLQAAPVDITNAVKTGEVSATLATAVIRKNKGDTKAAAKEIAQAVETAKASGKTKATAKHVQPSLKVEVREIFSRATVAAFVPHSFTFTQADFERLQKLFKLEIN